MLLYTVCTELLYTLSICVLLVLGTSDVFSTSMTGCTRCPWCSVHTVVQYTVVQCIVVVYAVMQLSSAHCTTVYCTELSEHELHDCIYCIPPDLSSSPRRSADCILLYYCMHCTTDTLSMLGICCTGHVHSAVSSGTWISVHDGRAYSVAQCIQ